MEIPHFKTKGRLSRRMPVWCLLLCIPWQGLAFSDSTTVEKAARFKKEILLNGGASQFKEAYNNGLVFTGPMCGIGFGITPTRGICRWFYQADISAGATFTRKMPAYAFGFMPLYGGLDYCLDFCNTHRLRLHLAVSLSFYWQMYPFLHNSHLFYQTEIPLWLGFSYAFLSPYGVFEADAAFSVLGFSASTSSNEPYFYRLDFHEFVGKPLQELRFGFPNTYLHLLGSIHFRPTSLSRHAFGFSIEYLRINPARRHQKLSYSLSWKKTF